MKTIKSDTIISIIIPTLNEEEGIAKVICSIPEEIKKKSELIVVDVSDDFTSIIAGRLGAIVLKEKKGGKGWQMRQAVKKSKGDILIFLDGDGTDPAQYIPKLLKKLEKANLVLGCRNSEKFDGEDQKNNKLWNYNKIISYPASYMLGLKVSDPLAGFRAIRRKDWDKLNLKSSDFEIETEMNIKALKNNFIIEQVLIPNLKRCGGVRASKFNKNPKMWFKIFKMILDYSREKSEAKNNA
ncbi:MAG: hypothetical protein A2908_01515 [Candidatus Staskawiczbacteria bacterium RIFCSPLOWO2_01_FULL_38_12b]|uniref:Glycosyltransferase 2-like domain-containing protein n=1 Tax=Candidatus Staskawiczbacteria bacterium RIFCSPLOWO2_01_FULL_38_12b TaxID=1802214 RepID=A0A1G2ID87_9BACT|nr:MAG: hypothetical protein A2908_01515 [Candidatus Staskawiczbacteria bacterium RIFCSPLOWO2_01_FULL_38_12b]